MKNIILVSILLISLLVACQKKESPAIGDEKATASAKLEVNKGQMASLVRRGEYLVTISGCHDCHSPKKMTPEGPVPDESRLLSGHRSGQKIAAYNPAVLKDFVLFNDEFTAAVGPWGVSFAANLTSDETGIGNWEEKQFMLALREGKFKGLENGRPLLPPMPWQNFANLTDDDMKAIFTYLKSTKPIRNIVPAPIPPMAASTS